MQQSTKKHILWISRHPMVPEQLADLERVMGAPVQLAAWTDTVTDVSQLRSAVEQADAIAAVLPMELLGQLLALAKQKPVLQALAWRIPTGRLITRPDGQQEREFSFAHRGWQQVLEVRIKTKNL